MAGNIATLVPITPGDPRAGRKVGRNQHHDETIEARVADGRRTIRTFRQSRSRGLLHVAIEHATRAVCRDVVAADSDLGKTENGFRSTTRTHERHAVGSNDDRIRKKNSGPELSSARDSRTMLVTMMMVMTNGAPIASSSSITSSSFDAMRSTCIILQDRG